MRRLVLAVLAATLLCACGSDEGDGEGEPQSAASSGGPVDTGPFDIPWFAEGVPPIQPSPAHTCPEGFTQETTDTGVISCRPWPAGGPAACSGREAHFPGEPGCAPVGTACPAGDFPENLPAGRDVVYVLAGATGGNGTKTSPYGSIGAAIASATNGAIVAVGKGTYTGRVELDNDVTVWGACPDETILRQTVVSEAEYVIGAYFSDGGIRNLTVHGPGTMGIYADSGNQLHIEDVVVDAASGYGLYLADPGTHAEVASFILRDATAFVDDTRGVGIQAIDGATATVRRASIERSAQVEVVVAFDSEITLDRTALRDGTGLASDPRAGIGLVVQESSRATITASGFWGNVGGGALVALGSQLTLTDVAFEEMQDDDEAASAAVESRVDSTLDASFVYVEHAKSAAFLGGENGVLNITDLVVRDTLPSVTSLESGVAMSLEGTSQATLSRVLLTQNRRAGIVTMTGTRLHASDIVVRDTLPSGPGGNGLGMALFGVDHVLERAIIDNCTMEGLAAANGAVLALTDVLVRDTRSSPVGGLYGRAIEVNLGSVVTADRVVLERNRDVSVMVVDPGSTFNATNLVIRDSLAQECGDNCVDDAPFGYGITARTGGQVQLGGFLVTRSFLLGMQVGPGSSIVGARGEVSENVIGINVQEPSYDAGTALGDVVFRDNVNNYDGESVPLPNVGVGTP